MKLARKGQGLLGGFLALLVLAGSTGAAQAQSRRPVLLQDSRYYALSATWILPDADRKVDDGFGGRALTGIPLGPGSNLELSVSNYSERRKGGGQDSAFGVGLDLMFPRGRGMVRPFFLVGAGYLVESILGKDDGSMYGDAGIGLLVNVMPRVDLRVDGTYLRVLDEKQVPGRKSADDIHGNFGIQVAFGEPTAPPSTAPGRAAEPAVAAQPPAATGDSDGDGVPDSRDSCPGTTRGELVDRQGCPLDSDGDGVGDARDLCPGTAPRARVDASGCPADADGDGVPNAADQCPNTPQGLQVTADGCVLNKAQTVVLQNVNFEFNSDRLTADAQAMLRQIAVGVKSQPELKVEIAGHTDSRGKDAYNLRLSQRRAESVRKFLVGEGVANGQLTARGYGETKPVADNKTDQGRALNRRVEFSVIGK